MVKEPPEPSGLANSRRNTDAQEDFRHPRHNGRPGSSGILLAAGGLLIWGHSFVDTQVHNQLAAQKIYFPPNISPAIKATEFAAMHQYAGAAFLLTLSAPGYAHLRRVSPIEEVFSQLTGTSPATKVPATTA